MAEWTCGCPAVTTTATCPATIKLLRAVAGRASGLSLANDQGPEVPRAARTYTLRDAAGMVVLGGVSTDEIEHYLRRHGGTETEDWAPHRAYR